MRALAITAVLLVAGFAGCGDAASSARATASEAAAMRTAAVHLVFADVNATALPRAYDRTVLRRRMSRYVAGPWLEWRVARTVAAIDKVGGRHYTQPYGNAITVGRWEAEKRDGRKAKVVFLAYETVTAAGYPTDDLPMERFTVRMYHERGRWRLITYDKHWLTPEGPMGQSGVDTISALPERVVFRNPQPRA